MRSRRGVGPGLAVVVLWASAFPAIQIAVAQLGVIGLSFVRLAVAAAALLVLGVLRRIRRPRARDLGWIVAAGFFGMTAYQLLLNASELAVPAGTASIIVAAAPSSRSSPPECCSASGSPPGPWSAARSPSRAW
ncbi:EamA family transporter [Amnibacterium kyonggiense]